MPHADMVLQVPCTIMCGGVEWLAPTADPAAQLSSLGHVQTKPCLPEVDVNSMRFYTAFLCFQLGLWPVGASQ
jgi:hypothetical protein